MFLHQQTRARLKRLGPCHAGIAWERWLELWQQIPLAHIPGYPYWEPQVFRALSENFGVLLRVYSYYAKLSWLRSFSSSETHALTVGGAEWAQFVTDCRMTSAKFDEVQVNKQQVSGTGTAGAYLPEFLSSLLALAFWRGNSFAEGNADAIHLARRERRLRPLPYCIGLVLREHVVPLAHRDSSQRFRARCVLPRTPAPLWSRAPRSRQVALPWPRVGCALLTPPWLPLRAP